MGRMLYQIEPILEARMWGGTNLIERFHLDTELQNVAEMYCVIAIPDHLDCIVAGKQQPLSESTIVIQNCFNVKKRICR